VERTERKPGPLRILWAARWEHDKNPEDFFAALKLLKERQVRFRVSVVGEQFRETPAVFAWAREYFADDIDRWGYQGSPTRKDAFGSPPPDRAEYEAALQEADVFVSTAWHEFFGLSAVEATLAGAYPLMPARLAYPETFDLQTDPTSREFFYDGSPQDLAGRLAELARRVENNLSLPPSTRQIRHRLERFEWPSLAPALDDAVERIAAGGRLYR
jgi:glycosyltransferase involved in cell wall biosynthesis